MSLMDLTGKQFDRLTVLSRAPNSKDGDARWICKCVCGKTKTILGKSLKSGSTRSCGCLQREKAIGARLKHGLYKTPEYHVWEKIIDRCYNPKHKQYYSYGGRGIKMCADWRTNPEHFVEWLHSHGWKRGLQIDRINNDLGYYPENCRVVERHTNSNNRKCTRRFPNGDSMAEVCRAIGIEMKLIKNGKRIVSSEYNKIASMFKHSGKLHPLFIDACISKNICPARYLRKCGG